MRRSRGTTLVEMLVYCVLLGVLLTGVYAVLLAGVRNYAIGANATELEQAALKAATRLSRELAEGDAASFRVDSSPVGIVFASPRDSTDPKGRFAYNSANRMLWQSYVCYYLGTANGAPALIRKVTPISPTVSSPPTIPSTLTSAWFAAQTGIAPTWTGFNVSGLSVTPASPMTLSVTATRAPGVSQAVAGVAPDSVQLQTRIFMRN